MKTKTKDGQLILKIVDTIRELVTNANLHFSTNDGLKIQEMDSAHVSLVSVHLPVTLFDPWQLENDVVVGVQLEMLRKILKCSSSAHDQIQFVRTETDEVKNTLQILFESEKKKCNSAFNMKLMEIERDEMNVPAPDPHVSVTLTSAQYQRIMREMKDFGDSLTITVTSDRVVFQIPDDSAALTVSGDITLKAGEKGEDDTATITMHKPETKQVSHKFALKYLDKFGKGSALSKNVTLHLSPEQPLIVEFLFADNVGRLSFYLAPKMEDT